MIPGTQKWPFFVCKFSPLSGCLTKMPFLGAAATGPSDFQVWKECDATFHQGEFWDQYGCPGLLGVMLKGGPVG